MDDLSKLSNVVDNDVAKKTVYNQLVTKVNAINSSKLVKKLTTTQKLRKFQIKFLIIKTPKFNNSAKQNSNKRLK